MQNRTDITEYTLLPHNVKPGEPIYVSLEGSTQAKQMKAQIAAG